MTAASKMADVKPHFGQVYRLDYTILGVGFMTVMAIDDKYQIVLHDEDTTKTRNEPGTILDWNVSEDDALVEDE